MIRFFVSGIPKAMSIGSLAALVATAVIAFVAWEEIASRRAVRQFWIDRANERQRG